MKRAWIHTAATAAQPCPVCRANLDAATGVSLSADDTRPTLKIGALSVCAYCSAILTLTTIGFRLASEDEVNALDPTSRRIVTEYASRRRPRS